MLPCPRYANNSDEKNDAHKNMYKRCVPAAENYPDDIAKNREAT